MRVTGRGGWRLVLAIGGMVLTGWVTGRVQGQADVTARLSTVLVDLAATVPQERGATRPDVQTTSRLPARTDWPASITDATDTARLRITATGEVQVYVLFDEVTDEATARLRAAGAV